MKSHPVLQLPMMLALLGGATGTALAGHPPPTNVPPTLEIEILDPNADSQGRPAVELNRDKSGNLVVDIPPVILVHRYFYTGDRSFQAQILPGGPSIVVANHPRTGERCYIPVQMLPGAPRVSYQKGSIEYDYGQNGITVHFPWWGTPSVKYRSGETWQRKIGDLVHADDWRAGAVKCADHTVAAADYTKTMACGAAAQLGDATKTALLPVTNVVRVLPLGSVLIDTDWEEQLTISAAEHERDHRNKKAENEARRREYSLPTIQ